MKPINDWSALLRVYLDYHNARRPYDAPPMAVDRTAFIDRTERLTEKQVLEFLDDLRCIHANPTIRNPEE